MPVNQTRRTILGCLSLILLASLAVGWTGAFDAVSLGADAKAAPAVVEKIVWPAWQIPVGKVDPKLGLSVEPDAGAESVRPASVIKAQQAAATAAAKAAGKPAETYPEPRDETVALIQRVTRSEIATHAYPLVNTPVVRWDSLKPGVYRVSARIAWDGDTNVIGTPIQLSVNTGWPDEMISKPFYGIELDEPGKFQTISILYELEPDGPKRLAARHAYHAVRHHDYVARIFPDAVPAPKLPSPSPGFQVTLELPRTKYSAEIGLPPNSIRTIKVDWIKVERIDPSPSITVRYVKAQKIWLKPGMEQPITVSLQNYTASAQKRTVSVFLVRGIDERISVGEQEVELAPGENKQLSMTWKTTPQTPNWGYEVVAQVKSADKVESSAHDYFSLTPQVYETLVSGSRNLSVDPFRFNESYQNQIEVFGATRGDCAGMTVPGETWFSGMMSGGIPQSYKLTKGCTDLNRDQGIATHMYLFAGGTGAPVIDLYEKHPEWMASRIPTLIDEVYRKNMEYDAFLAKQDFSKGIPEPYGKMPHAEMGMLWWDKRLIDKVTADAVAFVSRTGYDGIRFDVGMFGPTSIKTVLGTTLPYNMNDAMTVGAKNFEQFSDALHKVNPDFEFGANMDTWAYLEQVGKRNVTPKAPEEYPEWMALAKVGGMFMDEGSMDAPGFDHYMNRFEDALWSMRTKEACARKYGGVYQLFSPYRNGTGYFAHDDIYWSVFIVASGSVYVGSFSAPPYSDSSLGAFITRFGEYFRSKGLAPLTGADEKIAVNSPSPLWFVDTAVFEDMGNKRRYVIPLINPPIAERLRRNKSGEMPPPIKEPFEIRVKFPEGYATAKAYMLTWEPTVGAKALTLKKDGDAASIQFPEVDLCRTLVVEFEK